MTLSCESGFQKRTYGPGIYISPATIADVVDVSGTTLPFMERPVDIGFKLILDIGRDFKPELVIAGNFKRDPDTNEVIGWSSAFVVSEALAKLGYSGNLNADNTIAAEVLEHLVGITFLKLAYVSGVKPDGKLRYCDWNQIATLDEGAESLAGRFRKSLTRGYPKNYKPQLLEEARVSVAAVEVADENAF